MDAQAETLKFDVSKVDMSLAPVACGYDDEDLYCGTELFSLDPLESENAGMPVWLQPGNTLKTPPGEMRDGHVWKRVDDTWQELEDHRGETGFVNGEPFTIKELGPLPAGWSIEPPEPTVREKILAQTLELEAQQTPRRLREAALTDEGRVWLQNLENQIAAKRAELAGLQRPEPGEMLLPDYPPISWDALAQIKTYRAALRDLPAQPGAPWDGGGDEVPWPELPTV